MLSLYGIIYVTWYTRHLRCVFQELPEPNMACHAVSGRCWKTELDRSRDYQTPTRHALLGSGRPPKTALCLRYYMFDSIYRNLWFIASIMDINALEKCFRGLASESRGKLYIFIFILSSMNSLLKYLVIFDEVSKRGLRNAESCQRVICGKFDADFLRNEG